MSRWLAGVAANRGELILVVALILFAATTLIQTLRTDENPPAFEYVLANGTNTLTLEEPFCPGSTIPIEFDVAVRRVPFVLRTTTTLGVADLSNEEARDSVQPYRFTEVTRIRHMVVPGTFRTNVLYEIPPNLAPGPYVRSVASEVSRSRVSYYFVYFTIKEDGCN
jgi:hypothetical protein